MVGGSNINSVERDIDDTETMTEMEIKERDIKKRKCCEGNDNDILPTFFYAFDVGEYCGV